MKIPGCVMGEKPVNQECPDLESPEVNATDPGPDTGKVKGVKDEDQELDDDVFEPDSLLSQNVNYQEGQGDGQPRVDIDDSDLSKPEPPPRSDSHRVRHMVDLLGEGEEEEEEHFYWSRQTEYLLSCIGFVNGLGSLLRFTTLIVKHGGGVFFVAYVVLMALCGCPLVYLETALGQYANGGPVSAWAAVPLFQGLGYCMLVITFLISSYYIIEVAWAIYYLGLSIIGAMAGYQLPWSCSNNTDNQYCRSPAGSAFTSYYLISPTSLPHGAESSDPVQHNTDTVTVQDEWSSLHSSHSLAGLRYFYEGVLRVSPTVTSLGQPQWLLVLCLLLAWVIVFCCLLFGPKSIGKVMYLTATFPYLALPVIFIFSCFLDGSLEGVKFFLSPRWQQLGNLQIWTDAAWLMVYNVGLGTGCLTTLAGYTHFHSHCFRNLLLICLGNTVGMMVAGFTMCSGLGVFAVDLNTTVQALNITEYDLGFGIIPYILTKLSPSSVFVILFFLTVIIVGLDSMLVYVQNIVGGVLEIADRWGIKISRRRRWMVQIILCCLLFLTGLIYTTQGGLFVTDFATQYVGRLSLMMIVVAECCILMYMFGAHKFTNSIADMTGNKDSPWWHWNWKFITPIVLTSLVVLSLYHMPKTSYKDKSYPPWTEGMGWALMLSPLLLVPATMLVLLLMYAEGPLYERIKTLMVTPRFWGRGLSPSQDHSNSVPDYVICHPDNHRPAHGLAMLTANLYIPNLSTLEGEPGQGESTSEMTGGYLSDLMTITSTDSIESVTENKERGNWRGKLEFVLSCLGYVVGLGNIWRFPYLVYRNGGGAFFIPYLIMLSFCGIPLVYMEMAFGQYASLGPITIWKAVPLFKGVGYCMVLSSVLIAIYYNVVNAWAFHYLFSSFYGTLPWATCNNDWNTNSCKENQYYVTNCSWINTTMLTDETLTTLNSSCPALLLSCATQQSNSTEKFDLQNVTRCSSWLEEMYGRTINIPGKMVLSYTSPSQEYFYNEVLNQSAGLQELGTVQWQLALYLLLCWFIVFLCLVKGIYSAGKVAYVIVLVPILILVVLLICAMMVEGHLAGIKFYVTPKWQKVLEPRVWSDAASQVFFSLSACGGGLSTLSSYNKFKSNIYRDAVVVCLIDTLMSVLAGFTVFASMGILAQQLNTTVENVVTSNTGLVFVAFPAAVTHFQPSSMWSVFFFLMIVMMGMSSNITMVETVVTAIIDENVLLLRKWRIVVLLVTCCAMFLLGLPLTTQAGSFLLELMDSYCGGIPTIVAGIFMCSALSYVYGVKRFCRDISHMIDYSVSYWWKIMWCGLTPLIILFILVSTVISSVNLDPKQFPSWTEGFGIFLAMIPIVCIPILAVKKFYTAEGGFIQRLRSQCQSSKDWGPALEKHWNHVEYYPAVNTHTLSVDMEQSPVHTVSDRIDFSTSGMKLPSLSEASLVTPSVQMSPKKPQTIRQKAILNHAYSNPQCTVSTVSIDKLPKPVVQEPISAHPSNVVIISRKTNSTEMKDVAIQTDAASYIRSLWRMRAMTGSHIVSLHCGGAAARRDRRNRNSVSGLQETSPGGSYDDIRDAHRCNSVTVLQGTSQPVAEGTSQNYRLRPCTSDLGDSGSRNILGDSGFTHRDFLRNSLKGVKRARKRSDDTDLVSKKSLVDGHKVQRVESEHDHSHLGATGGQTFETLVTQIADLSDSGRFRDPEMPQIHKVPLNVVRDIQGAPPGDEIDPQETPGGEYHEYRKPKLQGSIKGEHSGVEDLSLSDVKLFPESPIVVRKGLQNGDSNWQSCDEAQTLAVLQTGDSSAIDAIDLQCQLSENRDGVQDVEVTQF